jgi:hypothetical protein
LHNVWSFLCAHDLEHDVWKQAPRSTWAHYERWNQLTVEVIERNFARLSFSTADESDRVSEMSVKRVCLVTLELSGGAVHTESNSSPPRISNPTTTSCIRNNSVCISSGTLVTTLAAIFTVLTAESKQGRQLQSFPAGGSAKSPTSHVTGRE